ncbi:MAG: 5-histidylcysteine sulfoxide synthase [Candidatus Syntrophosphaera sp.]|nr:5-histidylcysteine sulfoxide synthase [Candidatus Syntrophosphaera sp.]
MDALKGIRTLVLNEPDPDKLREQVRRYFHLTYSIHEKLYETLADDATFYLRADPLRHPLVFYLGHAAAFFVNKLIIGKIINARINPAFESMFAIGVDEMSWDDLNEANYAWPEVSAVRDYRDQVRAMVDTMISELPLDEKGITWSSPWWPVVMGIEHERIHLETSSVLIRQLPLGKVRQLDFWNICPEAGDAPENKLIPVSGGKVKLGRDDSSPLYGWDNEYGHASFEVQPFKASRYLVSNAEFLEFIEAGGYQRKDFWTEEGWSWKTFQRAEMPRFWRKEGEGYKLRLLASEIALPWNWPVEVNYLEAKAFCNWKASQTGKAIRLPSEEEWMLLRDSLVKTDQPWWDKAPGNINLEYWASSCPVDRFQFGDLYDVIGNVWQWTETPIYPYPGFKIHPVYDDFTVPTFDGRHNLIKGGSWISTGNEALRDSRYAFRRHFYQHAGFRYIESSAPVAIHDEPYEADPTIIPWCDADWGDDPLGEKNISPRLIEALKPWLDGGGKALHLGCRTGRGTFELARHFDSVTGLDFTTRLIRLATHMREKGFIRYLREDEGEIQSYLEKALADYGLVDFADRVEFWQADVSNLLAKFSGYDFILAENAIGGAINPRRFLTEIPSRLDSRGILAIADAYAYDPEVTLRENRIGGFRKDGEPYTSFDGLKELLEKDFELLEEPRELLQALRRGERLFELRRVQLSVWRKRA